MPPVVEIAYFTKDVPGMTAFYARLLGGPPVAQSPEMAIFMTVSGTKLFLHKHYAQGDGELPPENHVAYGVTDVDAACAALQQQGVIVEVAPHDYYWGRSAYLRDPDGHLIELNRIAVQA
jgi:catechol 2,3-dioxygenase-like lactoylglutathione lyase family enzyme